MNTRERLNETALGGQKDKGDGQVARWGRSRIEGWQVSKQGFVQPPPMFFTEDHHPLWLGDIYRGRSAFLIAGGPSFVGLDHSLLNQPGILTVGLNNAVKTYRPNLWISVDSPDHFVRSVWLDPTIMKFVPICHAQKSVFNSDTWRFMDLRVGDCPNVVYFRRNEKFNAAQFLWEDTINWGNHKKHGGGRSVMLAALRILFLLGIRKIFLLGVDFRMNATSKYHFDQDRKGNSINGNNSTYKKLERRFTELKPVLEDAGLFVYNCNPHSKLKVFDFVPYETAIGRCLAEFDFVDVANERTEGLYDTKEEEKREGNGR